MRRVIVILFLFLGQQLTAQTQLNGLIEVPQTFSFGFARGSIFSQTNLHLGLQLSNPKQKVDIYSTMQFGGDLYAYYDREKNYTLNYLAVGGGVNYRFLGTDKKFSPIIKVEILTEIYSNYRGKYMDEYLMPFDHPDHYWNGSFYHYYNFYYVSTPWISTLAAGFDYQIVKGLSLNASVGYGIRLVKRRLQSFLTSETDPDLSVGIDLSEKYKLKDINWSHMLDIHLGLSYTFPFKKKE